MEFFGNSSVPLCQFDICISHFYIDMLHYFCSADILSTVAFRRECMWNSSLVLTKWMCALNMPWWNGNELLRSSGNRELNALCVFMLARCVVWDYRVFLFLCSMCSTNLLSLSKNTNKQKEHCAIAVKMVQQWLYCDSLFNEANLVQTNDGNVNI